MGAEGDVMAEGRVSLVLFGGTVHTLDDAGTAATAVAVSRGKIVAVGSDAEITRLAGPRTRRIDLGGSVVLPGLIDSHMHVSGVGHVSEMAFLYDTWSIDEILDRLRQRAAETSGSVVGRGGNFHESSLAEGRLPTAADLDRVATDRPVIITDVNKTIVNSFVLRTMDTDAVPPGGEVPRDGLGRPLGIFMYAAKAMTPLAGPLDSGVKLSVKEAILRGLETAARLGFTGLLEAMVDLESISAFRAIEQERGLPIRASIMPYLGGDEAGAGALKGVSIEDLDRIGAFAGLTVGRLSFGPIKLLFDGWIMHRTALLHEPYVGLPDHVVRSWLSQKELGRRIDKAFEAGWPVGIHTTGDRGSDIAASTLAQAIETAGGSPGRSHLIHVYFPTEEMLDITLRHDLAIAAQPAFIRTWGETVRAFVGEDRARRFKPLRTMLDRGLTVGGGADAPITWPDPWTGIYAAVTRRTEGGQVLGERERITVEEALRCYTLGSAAILQQEDIRGSIEEGKLADFTIIDRDILAIDPEGIMETRVLKTIVGGEVVYDAVE